MNDRNISSFDNLYIESRFKLRVNKKNIEIIKDEKEKIGQINIDTKRKIFKILNPNFKIQIQGISDIPVIGANLISQDNEVLITGSCSKDNLNSIYNSFNKKSFIYGDIIKLYFMNSLNYKDKDIYLKINKEGFIKLKNYETKSNVKNYLADNYLVNYGYLINGNIQNIILKKECDKYLVLKNKDNLIIYKSKVKNVNWFSKDQKNYSGYQALIESKAFLALLRNVEISFYIEYFLDNTLYSCPIYLNSKIRDLVTLNIKNMN